MRYFITMFINCKIYLGIKKYLKIIKPAHIFPKNKKNYTYNYRIIFTGGKSMSYAHISKDGRCKDSDKRTHISVDVWGDFAEFSRPEFITDRATYYVPTPSACRGILNAIFCKPLKFYYQITSIEVMNPIRTILCVTNEIKEKAQGAQVLNNADYYIDSNKSRTQRYNTFLRDVYYRINADIVVRDDANPDVNITALYNQFCRRVKYGKCKYQPYFGIKGCMAFFSEPDMTKTPIAKTKDYGIMLYDVFDIKKADILDTSREDGDTTCVSFYRARMEDGIIHVPEWGDERIFTKGACEEDVREDL